jgi:hypothetical protein
MLSNFIEQVKSHVDRSSLVPADWMVKNFTNPRDDRKPWSWDKHEYQIDIANVGEEVREVATIKCAQVGLSTLQIRSIIAFLVQHTNLKAAYVLPTSAFAREFAQSRINPAIEASPSIAALVSNDADNTSIKKIGSCFLIMRGTSGTTAAISQDLDMLITDELDFANQAVLSSFSSRLQHSDLKLRRDFSTPTLPGFGIAAKYAESSQGVRLVKCEHCNEWVAIDYYNDIVIPGFEQPMSEFRSEHAMHPGIREAWYKCQSCGGKISEQRLADPHIRAWVEKHPGHWRKGFKVSPWDLPHYNPLHEVLTSIKDYTYGDYINFRIGLPFESSENSFMTSVIERNSTLPRISLAELMRGGYYGLFVGVDLGKVAHVVVGAPTDRGVDVICAEQVDVNSLPEQNLGKFLVQLHNAVRCPRMVVDAMPDYSVGLHLAAMNKGFGAFYSTTTGLDIYNWDEIKGVVKIARDGHLDDCASWVNSGRIKFPIGSTLMREHFSVVKKTKVQTAKGMAEKWTSTSSEDHFCHAFGYMFAAYASVKERFYLSPVMLPPQLGSLRMKV